MQVSPANLYRLNYSYTGEYERNGNRAKGKRDARDREKTGIWKPPERMPSGVIWRGGDVERLRTLDRAEGSDPRLPLCTLPAESFLLTCTAAQRSILKEECIYRSKSFRDATGPATQPDSI